MSRVRTRFQSQTKDNAGQMQLPLIQRKSNVIALSVFRQGDSLFNETIASILCWIRVLVIPCRGNKHACHKLGVGVPIPACLGLLTIRIDRMARRHSCWHFTLECGADRAISDPIFSLSNSDSTRSLRTSL
jgi:hypothetical protein